MTSAPRLMVQDSKLKAGLALDFILRLRVGWGGAMQRAQGH